ncbi:MAG: SCO family protein [Pseudomonadota bacterium]
MTIHTLISRRRALQSVGCAGLYSVGLLGLSACERKVVSFKSTDITGIAYAKKLNLPDAEGRARDLSDFKGKVVVVFFGYTQCPDVCPTTLAELAAVKKALGPDGERLQALFITIDPERDTPEVLKTYVTSFDPSFVALRGSVEQTQAVAKDFKIYFSKIPGKTPTSYTMDHSAGNFVFDTRGEARLLVRNGTGVDAWVADVKALLSQA